MSIGDPIEILNRGLKVMSDKEFKEYVRTNIAEMRPYVEGEVLSIWVSISEADRENGSPKIGDMIARNPENHQDQWLVAESYFKDNFESRPANKPDVDGEQQPSAEGFEQWFYDEHGCLESYAEDAGLKYDHKAIKKAYQAGQQPKPVSAEGFEKVIVDLDDIKDLLSTMKRYIDGDVPTQGIEVVMDEFQSDYVPEMINNN